MAKVTLCTNWLDACAGCHMSLLDIDELIVDLLDKVELLSSPITDLKHPPEEGCDVGLLTGAVSDSHQVIHCSIIMDSFIDREDGSSKIVADA